MPRGVTAPMSATMTGLERELLLSVEQLAQQYRQDSDRLRQELVNFMPRWSGVNEQRLTNIERCQAVLNEQLHRLAGSLESLSQSLGQLREFEALLKDLLSASLNT